MSYHTYIDYGFGIKTTELKKPIEKKRLLDYIATAPEYKKEFDRYLKEYFDGHIPESGEEIIDGYRDYGEGEYHGLATIMQSVMEETISGLSLYTCEDYESDYYLMYLYLMPWQMNDFDRGLTKEKLAEYFEENLKQLTDEELKADWVESENGG